MKLTNGKFNNLNTRENVTFFTNKVFHEIIVRLRIDLHIFHTVILWLASESTTHMKILLSRTNIVSHGFINIFNYATQATSHGIAKFSNELSEWTAKCSKPHLHETGWSLTFNNKFNNSNVIIFIMICIKQRQAQFIKWNIEPHHSSVKISEHGEHRLHTLYMQEESLKPKISIYTYWKLAEAGNSNSYRAPHWKRWSMVWIAEPQRDCTTSFFQKIKIISCYNLASRSSILDN